MKMLPFVGAVMVLACASLSAQTNYPYGIDPRQIPTWSQEDLEFFLHGSMGTEVAPERMLVVFQAMYPDLFPGHDLSEFGLITENAGALPIGISRREVPHLGGLPSLGINCASCHVTEAVFAKGSSPQRILGANSHFDVQAYFTAMVMGMARTASVDHMEKFLSYYLRESDPEAGSKAQTTLAELWKKQKESIAQVIQADPTASKNLKPGALHELKPMDVALTAAVLQDQPDLSRKAQAFLKLFHNIRASLHVPDEPPAHVPVRAGPGRNDAFGLLAASFFNIQTTDSPAKHGIVWNLHQRSWVHWDGNNNDPIARNLSASLGLGAPIVEGKAVLDFSLVQRHTELSQGIFSPIYPLPVDKSLAAAGEKHFQAQCASCHAGPETDERLFAPEEIGTDPNRAAQLDEKQAQLYRDTLKAVTIEGFTPSDKPPFRITRKYWSPTLGGVWARSPYLHNGSVRTMWQLLEAPASRPQSFYRGAIDYDINAMGYVDAGPFVLSASETGNKPGGHDYGSKLTADQKRELIEYLKTL